MALPSGVGHGTQGLLCLEPVGCAKSSPTEMLHSRARCPSLGAIPVQKVTVKNATARANEGGLGLAPFPIFPSGGQMSYHRRDLNRLRNSWGVPNVIR